MKLDDGKPRKLDAAARTQVIDAAIAALHKEYVFPKVAAKIEKRLRDHLKGKRYDALASPDKFATQLTADLVEISEDKHLAVHYSAERLPDDRAPDAPLQPRDKADLRAHAAACNAFFVKAERLAGNIGYLRIDGFAHPLVAASPAAAAMTFVADTDELIIDLRNCVAGHPETVALVVSYLYDAGQAVHVSSVYWRADDRTRQYWTSTEVAGRRYADKPVYVLTSSATFSGGEDFAYAVRSLKRGKLFGEVTAGGAHPTVARRLAPSFGIEVPAARSIGPVSRSNWQGSGVKPHVETEAADALAAAYHAALQSQTKRLRGKGGWLAAEVEQALKKAARKA